MITSPTMQGMMKDLADNNIYIVPSSGVPADDFGNGICGKGSLAIDFVNGDLYINTGTISATTWTQVNS